MPLLRNANKSLPTVHVVDPAGRIRFFKIGIGVDHRIVRMQPKRDPLTGAITGDVAPALTEVGHFEGWKFLDDLFKSEKDEEIRTKGKELWDEYCRHAAADKHGGQDFPDEWLPKEVRDRRRGKRPNDTPELKFPKRSKGAKAEGAKAEEPKA